MLFILYRQISQSQRTLLGVDWIYGNGRSSPMATTQETLEPNGVMLLSISHHE